MSLRRRLPALSARLLRAAATGGEACASSRTPAARFSMLAASAARRSWWASGAGPCAAAGVLAAPTAASRVLARPYSSLPPHTELLMPALSPTMTQGNLVAWKVQEGQELAPGDVLAEVETDKATLSWENQVREPAWEGEAGGREA